MKGLRRAVGLLLIYAALATTWASPSASPVSSVNIDLTSIRKSAKDFCDREPDQCGWTMSYLVEQSTEKSLILIEVNSEVNGRIRRLSDQAQYGVKEFWTLPRSGIGDCEDIALEKRRLLIERGFPKGALRLVAGENSKEGHAVLGIWTTTGVIVLDNLTDQILPLEKSSLKVRWGASTGFNLRQWVNF